MTSLTKKITQLTLNLVLIVGLAGLAACGGSSDIDEGEVLLSCELPLIPSADGSSCVEQPPIFCEDGLVPNETNDACVAPPDPNAPPPTVMAGENEAILFYNRPQDATNETGDPVYDGYRLHTWNNETCDSYESESLAASWDNGLQFDGIDPAYGAYWILQLKPGHNGCGNFIIHIGTDDAGKELGGGDWTMSFNSGDPAYFNMNWTLSGVGAVFESPIVSLGDLPLQISDFAAHWIDTNTLVWDVDTAIATEFKLHYSPSAGIEEEGAGLTGTAVTLTETALTPEQQAEFPFFSSWAVFTGEWTADEAKAMNKAQLVLAAYDTDGAFLATRVQNGNVLDALYTRGDNDADEQTLGVVYQDDTISVSVWAPTAQDVTLFLYDADKQFVRSESMTEDTATGIWSHVGGSDLDRMFYRFGLTVYHPQNDAIESIRTSDPYSVSLSTNGVFSQFVNLNDDDLKPEGWDSHAVPTVVDPEDAVIYEGHIRDFSVRDESTSTANRGKYLAFTEEGTAPVQHLSDLVASGLTHFHMLPANDIASINEDSADIVDITDTVADLCAVNENAQVCDELGSDNTTVLQDLFASYLPSSADAQALANDMRGYDSFNWGYDPKHFNVPDGIYASDPDGIARIVEMRAMNQALHEIGLRVVLDVVYNHTNSAGLWDNSVLDKVVPGYYHRRDLTTGDVQQSTCCNDTALEHRMMDKLMVDSLKVWTEQYKFDGFRFDIMSHGSVDQMLSARDAIQIIDPDNYFYGEGWFRGDGRDDQANQENMAGTEIATFNDRLREGIRSTALFHENGNMDEQDVVKLGMAGTLANYVLESSNGTAATGSSFSRPSYGLDPADVINYVSKHDNETLWDQLQYNLPFDMSLEERVRSQNIAISIPLMSQGIPFLQMGGDFLRSKSMDRNTYDAGDWFNYVDFTKNTNNWNVGLPLEQDNGSNWTTIVGIASSPLTQVASNDVMFASSVFKEFLSIRRDSKLFRLNSEADVIGRVGFHNIGSNQTQGVIVMSIDDGSGLVDLDPANDAIVVMINATGAERSHTVPTATGFTLHPTLATSVDARVASASFSEGTDEGTFTVPARTMAVFVKGQGATQGDGLSAYATSGTPDVVPYGDTEIYIRGDMNGWNTDNPLTYVGDGIYRTSIALTGSTGYGFKVASEDWSTVDFGSSDGVVTENTDKTLSRGAGNLSFTPAVDGSYFFELDASDPEAPIINVRNTETYAGTPIYIRGAINGWGTGSQLVHIGDGMYKVIVDVTTTGVQEFKIASEDWSTVDLTYGDGNANVTEDIAKLIGPGAGLGNMSMDFAVAGEYTFLFDSSDSNQKFLSVHQTKMYGDQAIYLKGSFNGWGNDDEMVYQGDSIYIFDKVLTAGDYEFKFANADWSDINYGANVDDQDLAIGVPKTLSFNTSNIRLTIPSDGIYRFTVSGPDDSAPQMTITAQ